MKKKKGSSKNWERGKLLLKYSTYILKENGFKFFPLNYYYIHHSKQAGFVAYKQGLSRHNTCNSNGYH